MPKFKKDDVIGCGINFFKKEIFFTHNGEVKGPAFKDIELCDFHATIGLHSLNECITMNFGKKRFMLSLEQLILDEKKATIKQILEQQVHHFDVHKIVHNYLYFHGYYETLYAFEQASNFQREDAVLLKDFEKKIENNYYNNSKTIEIIEDSCLEQENEEHKAHSEQKMDTEPKPASQAQLIETDILILPCEEHKQEKIEEEEEKKQLPNQNELKRGRQMRAVSCHIDLETPELVPRKVSNLSDLFEFSLVAKEQSIELQNQRSPDPSIEEQMKVLANYDLERQTIRHFLMEGKIQEVIMSLQNNFPTILNENPSLMLQLKCQIFIEIIKSGDILEAVKYATDNFIQQQNETIKVYNVSGKLEDKTIEDVMGLICYSKPEESNLKMLMSNMQRDLVADLVHKYILSLIVFVKDFKFFQQIYPGINDLLVDVDGRRIQRNKFILWQYF